MPISLSPSYSEVDESNYLAGTVSVTNSQIEAKVGGSRLSGRQSLMLFNASSNTIYFGPSGLSTTTGVPLFPNQFAQLSMGDSFGVYLIAATSGPFTVVVHEVS